MTRSQFAEQTVTFGIRPIKLHLRARELLFKFEVAHPANHRACRRQVAGANAQFDERGAFSGADDRFLSGDGDQRAVGATEAFQGMQRIKTMNSATANGTSRRRRRDDFCPVLISPESPDDGVCAV